METKASPGPLIASIAVFVGFLWAVANPGLAFSPLRTSGVVIPLEGEWKVVDAEGQAVGTVQVPFALQGQVRIAIERSFRLDSVDTNGQFLLVCDAAAGEVRLWLNGHFLGSQLTGFLGFEVPLDPAFFKLGGENRLRVEIDGRMRPKDGLPLRHRPGAPSEVTGIPGGMRLLQVPAVAVREVLIRRQEFRGNRLSLDVEVELLRRSLNEGAAGELSVEVWDPTKNTLIGSTSSVPIDFARALRTSVSLRIECEGVNAWSPQAPKLYELVVRMKAEDGSISDVWHIRTGFREVRVESGQLFLNGEPLRLRAVEWVPRVPGWGSAEAMTSLLSEIKSAGCNAVRVVGYPPTEAFLRAADSLGLFVLEEIPVWKAPGGLLSDPHLLGLVKDALTELVRRDQLHPSVFAWGLGTDLELWNGGTAGVLAELRRELLNVDERPCCAEVPLAGFRKMQRKEPPVDILLVDIADLPGDVGALKIDGSVVIPIIGYSLGGDPLSSAKRAERLEEIRSFRLWHRGKKWREDTAVGGLVVRAWSDWESSSARVPAGDPVTRWVRFGAVDPEGERRLSYFVLRALFAEDELPSLRSLEPPRDQVNAFTVFGVLLAGWFVWNFRRDRRFRGNIRRVFNYPSSIYEDVRSKRKISAYHTFLQGLFASSGLGLVGASFLVYARRSWLADEILELLLGTGSAKTVAAWLAWHPIGAFLALALGAMLFLVLVSMLFWVVSLVRFPVPLGQSFMFVFWVATAFHPAVLWGTIAYRLMMTSSLFVWLTFGLCFLLFLWFALRFVRGSGTILRISPWVAAAVFLLVIVLLKLPVLVWLENTRAFSEYLGYYLGMLL